MSKLRKALIAIALVFAFAVPGALVVRAQAKRPYRNGSAWQVNFIRMKPGMETAYLTYVANDWKREQEASKKAGFSLSPTTPDRPQKPLDACRRWRESLELCVRAPARSARPATVAESAPRGALAVHQLARSRRPLLGFLVVTVVLAFVVFRYFLLTFTVAASVALMLAAGRRARLSRAPGQPRRAGRGAARAGRPRS